VILLCLFKVALVLYKKNYLSMWLSQTLRPFLEVFFQKGARPPPSRSPRQFRLLLKIFARAFNAVQLRIVVHFCAVFHRAATTRFPTAKEFRLWLFAIGIKRCSGEQAAARLLSETKRSADELPAKNAPNPIAYNLCRRNSRGLLHTPTA
jgi:hypothetical protein